MFNKVIPENFPNLEKEMSICPSRHRRSLGIQTDKTRIEPPHMIL
jgi:hypothetical protein